MATKNEEDNQSNDNDDYEEGEEGEAEDDEATLDEEDDLNGGENYEDELKELQEENELSVEELRRKYYGNNIPEDEQETDTRDKDEEGEMAKEDIETQPTSSTLTRNMRGKIMTAFAETCQTITKYFRKEDLDEDDSEDYMPPEIWKKEIRVGSGFQVTKIPELEAPSNSKKSMDSELAQALWIALPEKCSDDKIVEYLVECEQIRAGEKQKGDQMQKKRSKNSSTMAPQKTDEIVPDDENALLALYQADYDLSNAKSQAPFEMGALCSVNGPRLTQQLGQWRTWNEEDCTNFEKGIFEYGKNFWKIHRDFLPNRKLGEIVCFYYSWKKSERHDIWRAEKNQRDQQMDVKTVDLMGQIAETILQGGNKNNEGAISSAKRGETTTTIP